MPKRNLIVLLAVTAVAAVVVWLVHSLESARREDQARVTALRQVIRHVESEALAWRLLAERGAPAQPDIEDLARRIAREGDRYKLKDEEWRQVMEGAVGGMIEALRKVVPDQYCRYIAREDKTLFEDRLRGFGTGLGLEADVTSGEAKVTRVLAASPAHRAGLVPGDRIIGIDGTDLVEMDEEAARARLDAHNGGAVSLTVLRAGCVRADGGCEQVLKLAPQRFEVRTVQGLLRGPDGEWDYYADREAGIAYLRITEFVKRTPEQLSDALFRQVGEARGVVVDLRDNPGGVPEAAAGVLDLFLDKGNLFTIVSIRDGKAHRDPFRAKKETTDPRNLPMVVLIDGRTASAAEIVAGSLRLHGRAVLVGRPTRGKTWVQSVIRVPDLGLIVMSSGRFYLERPSSPSPAGAREIQHVEPDESIAISRAAAAELADLRTRARALPGRPAFEPLTLAPGATLARELRRADPHLDRAVQLLADPRRIEEILESTPSGPLADHD
jgi:carboxyl-terminal processing protease